MNFTKFDFLTLWVKDDLRQANIDWYTRHLELSVGWDSPGEKLTLLQFPNKQAITLLAHYPEHDKLPESGVRVLLYTEDLSKTKHILEHEKVHSTKIYSTPWGAAAFDFFDLQG